MRSRYASGREAAAFRGLRAWQIRASGSAHLRRKSASGLGALGSGAAALLFVGSAAASLQPLPRPGDSPIPRVRAAPNLPPWTGRTRVIVTLDMPPLARAIPSRNLSATGSARRLNVASASSRAYLAQVNAAQRRALDILRREVPEARVSRRFRILVNGFAVSVPARRLQTLSRLGFVRKVYPSFRYELLTNRGPALIGAPQMRALTGGRGDGVKVAVVDDGVDWRNPFLVAGGLSYPAGFPKGNAQFTNQKVIVARVFPGPTTRPAGREPLDDTVSFHGTHVAGVIAGNENTTAPDSTVIPEERTPRLCVRRAGGCIPQVTGLSGVAPRAWIGNYRVFTVPNPLDPSDCCTAGTAEIIAAFEAAVADGMDVINFSGGGPESDPASDALMEAVANVVRAGVVPVIAAGNDRDLFGLGTVGSPGTAPDAIGVAAVTNAHTFAPALTVNAFPNLGRIAFIAAAGAIPLTWGTADQTLVDVSTIVGTDGRPVDPTLCTNTPPPGSLLNAIALISRGGCTYDVQGVRARDAGAIGVVVVDNRPGETNGIPFTIARPAGMIADLDGARLRAELAKTGGRAAIRIGNDVLEIATGRGGTSASFSAGGLTAFGHELKPDLAAPGAGILSSTVPDFAGANFAVLDGTSFSSPHVAGAAALLLQRNPGWIPKQVKSALMSTAGPAFADTAATTEAPVLLEGAGLVRLTEAVAPRIFTDPQSLSFRDLNVSGGAQSRSVLVQISDAGGGGGAWQVELQPQAASAGANVSVPPSVSVPPGGTATFPVVATAAAGAAEGDDYGFVVLRQGGVTRRIPYAFVVTQPKLAAAQAVALQNPHTGDTQSGADRVRTYRWPTSPFGLASILGVDVPLNEHGREQLYFVDVTGRAANVGVRVVEPELDPRASFEDLLISPIHPWFLGSPDENDVEGYAGTPVAQNSFLPDYLLDIRTAGTVFPRPGRYYVSIDSGVDPFGRSYSGRYVLRSWINDVRPPTVRLLTTQVAAGRPTIAFRAVDAQSGVDPFTVGIGHAFIVISASQFDTRTGIAVVPFPRQVNRLQPGRVTIRLIAADYQESKNVNTDSPDVMPNTARRDVRVRVVRRPTVTWLAPEQRACVTGRAQLDVVASSPAAISSVGFFVGSRQIARIRRGASGVFSATWNTAGARKGTRALRATVSDTAGRESSAVRRVRVC
jgi:minor extracellular serine protease Vpr